MKYLKAGRGVNPELKDLYGKYFVYFLLRKGKVVYIGSTMNIEQRISVHKSSLYIYRWFDSFRFMGCKNLTKALRYEKRWQKKFKPKYDGRFGTHIKPSVYHLTLNQYLSLGGRFTFGYIPTVEESGFAVKRQRLPLLRCNHT